jgi:hypothetical protein
VKSFLDGKVSVCSYTLIRVVKWMEVCNKQSNVQ